MTRRLLATEVHKSGESRIVCASDVSAAELRAAFHNGINSRGAFEPWAVVLNREAAFRDATGMRPVHYVDYRMLDRYRRACEEINGPGWGGLVVPTRLYSRIGAPSDWTHEREWRWCASPDREPFLFIGSLVKAVIVGKRGWVPEWAPPGDVFSGMTPKDDPEYTVERWYWDPKLRDLVPDGTLAVPALAPREAPVTNVGKIAEFEDAHTGVVLDLISNSAAGRPTAAANRRVWEARVETEQIFVGGAGTTPGTWGWELRCPFCGANTIDRNVDGEYVDDHKAVTVHPDQDKYESPIGTRGGFVSISMLCATCGRGFDFVVANHKGSEQIGIVPHS